MHNKPTTLASSLLGNSTQNRRLSPAGLARTPSPTPSGRFGMRRSTYNPVSPPSVTSSSRHSVCTVRESTPSSEASCVIRETSSGDCGRYRFITWAAVRRNAYDGMTQDERLECPLLRCRQRWGSHEEMLRHLATCDQLDTCEYWCYQHMKVERFDDKKCQSCLGSRSKRRRILCMARNFFTSLGHKGRKGAIETASSFETSGDVSMPYPPPPPSYDSIDVNRAFCFEMSDTPILEIDSTEIFIPRPPQPPQPNDSTMVDPQVLMLPEVDTRAISAGEPLSQQPLGLESAPVPAFVQQGPGCSGRPLLQLETLGMEQCIRDAAIARSKLKPKPVPTSRSKDLSPSSSVRSTTSTMSTQSNTSATSAASNASSLVSPISEWSSSSDLDFAKYLTSPKDVLIEPSEHGGADLSHVHQAVPALLFDSIFPPEEMLHEIFTELPADIPGPENSTGSSTTEPMGFEPPHAHYSVDPAGDGEICLLDDRALDTASELIAASPQVPDDISPRKEEQKELQSPSEALVDTAWEAMKEHFACSLAKTKNFQGNPLVDRVFSMTPMDMAKDGIAALQDLLRGALPTSSVQVVCLLHVVYALSLGVYGDDDLASRSCQLYLESAVSARLLGDPQLEELVSVIWRPDGVSKSDICKGLFKDFPSLRSRTSKKGKELSVDMSQHVSYHDDPFLCTARSFLDELECSVIVGPSANSIDVLTSALYPTHLDLGRPEDPAHRHFVKAAQAAVMLIARGFDKCEDLVARLKDVYEGLCSGSVLSVRRLELELLRAGKQTLSTRKYFGHYSVAVGQVCDSLYQRGFGYGQQRSVYHSHGIALLERIMSRLHVRDRRAAEFFLDTPSGEEGEFMFEAFVNTQTPPLTDAMAVDDFLTQFLDPGGKAAGSGDDSSDQDTDLISFVDPATTQIPISTATAAEPALADLPAANAKSAEGSAPKTEADDCCELCGYRPKGDPQWFKGSMAKHRRHQHSARPPIIYRCPFPGCTSAYRNRPDNLRQHQIEKGHFVEGAEPVGRLSKKRKKMSG